MSVVERSPDLPHVFEGPSESGRCIRCDKAEIHPIHAEQIPPCLQCSRDRHEPNDFGICPACRRSMDDPRYPGCFGVLIGVEVQGVYDGMLFWQCPYCSHKWHRWPDGTRQHAAAEEFVTKVVPA